MLAYSIAAVLANGSIVPADMGNNDLGLRRSFEKDGRLPMLTSGTEGLKSFTQLVANENAAMKRMTDARRKSYYGEIVSFKVVSLGEQP